MASTKASDLVSFEQCINEDLKVKLKHNRGIVEQSLGIRKAVSVAGGNLIKARRFNPLTGLVSRHDMEGEGTQTPTKLTETEQNQVVIRRKLRPVSIDEDIALSGSDKSVADLINEVNTQYGESYIADVRDTTYQGVIASVNAMTDTAHTLDLTRGAGASDLTYKILNRGKQLMGDRRTRLTTAIMNSDCYNMLIGDTLDNYNHLDNPCGTTLITGIPAGFGFKQIVVDDNMPSVVVDNGGVAGDEDGLQHNILLLGENSIFIGMQRELQLRTGHGDFLLENDVFMVKGYFDYSTGVMGMRWDGVVNPTVDQFATVANWKPAYSDPKEVEVVNIKVFEATA